MLEFFPFQRASRLSPVDRQSFRTRVVERESGRFGRGRDDIADADFVQGEAVQNDD